MSIKDNLMQVRSLMQEKGIDAYIINGSDPHMSEYLPDYWRSRQWISGFTGSFGNVVITLEKAGLWTDSRYFIQAQQELEGSGIDMYKLRVPYQIDIPTWLSGELKQGEKVAFDGFCMGVSEVKQLEATLNTKGIQIYSDIDLVSPLWIDRPSMPKAPVIEQTTDRSGLDRLSKLEMLRNTMQQNAAEYHLVGSLDDIAWILNLRGRDISYNPVVVSYLLVSKENASLFVDKSKLSQELKDTLTNQGISIEEYTSIIEKLAELKKDTSFLIDPNRLNYRIYSSIIKNHRLIEAENPSILLKSIKNSTEIQGMRKACIKDGVALTRFWYWLENNIDKSNTEISLAEKLTSFRAEQENYREDSFGAIVAYKENAALPHYSASKDSCSTIKPEGLLLIDSGGQYLDGTTDITRTMPVGKLSQEEKDDYTLVLKGMIAMSMLKFPKGTRGCNIDMIARKALWEVGMDYGHGTGHGIGSFLNVHEGPQSIRQDLKDQPIMPGMITSNEPGLYKEGRHGIRHENLILCVEKQTTEFGVFLGFETLTMCYFDTIALNTDLLDRNEIDWLNNYHKEVYSKLSPFLDEEHSNWLENKTRAISK